jgi:hypothetical protein
MPLIKESCERDKKRFNYINEIYIAILYVSCYNKPSFFHRI